MAVWGGIDLGGTFIKAAVVDDGGRLLGESRLPTPRAAAPAAVLDQMVAALSEAERLATTTVVAAGVGVPGLVDPDGRIRSLPNLPGWAGETPAATLAARLGRPVRIDNDANAAAMAERWIGAGRRFPDFLLLTLGTGIGGGLVLGGELQRGAHGRAAEPGHIKIEPHGLPCGCGATGCLEQYAAAPALIRAARAAIAAGRLAPPAMGEALTPEWLNRAARAGHPAAVEIHAEAAAALGQALAAVISIVDVTVFILAGGVAGAFDLLAPPLRSTLERRAFGLDPATLVLEPAACGAEAGMIGAALLAARTFPAGGAAAPGSP